MYSNACRASDIPIEIATPCKFQNHFFTLTLCNTSFVLLFLPSLIAQVSSLYFNFQNNLAALPVLFPFKLLHQLYFYSVTSWIVSKSLLGRNRAAKLRPHSQGTCCPVLDTARSKIPQTLLLDISRPTTTTTTTATMPTTSVPDKTCSAFIDSHVVDDWPAM